MASMPTTTLLPAEIKAQLPIFQVLGDKISTTVDHSDSTNITRPGGAGAKLIFAALLLLGGYAFYRALPTLIEFARMSILLVAFSIVLIVLLLLAPAIIRVLTRLGNTLLFKSEKAIVRNNPIESLQMLSREATDTLKKVKEKIASVNAVRIDMIQSGETAHKTAQDKFALAQRFTQQAGSTEASVEGIQNDPEKQNSLRREAKETRTKAFLVGKEGEAEDSNARSYAQYANQFAKVLEVLKDNESAARIYVSTLNSSISIIQKKMEATSKMKNATEGLAEVFNIKEGWVFQEAMGAATQVISQNIASIRSNLEFLDQNNSITVGGTPSQAELEQFMQKVENRHMKTLNVSEIASAGHELSRDEKVDKGFTLLD